MFKLRSNQLTFRDRVDAGSQLALALAPIVTDVDPSDLVVIGLARGGVPVASEIARSLGGTLDACTIRKIRAPAQPELAIGAVGPGRTRILNTSLVHDLMLDPEAIQSLSSRAMDERDRIDNVLRDGRPPIPLADKVVILVDDGLATGASMRAALAAVARQRPLRMIIAVPVAPPGVVAQFRSHASDIVALIEPERFRAVSHWYQDFAPVSIAIVRDLMTTQNRSISTSCFT